MGNVANTLLTKSPNQIGISTIVLYEMEVGIVESDTTPDHRIVQLRNLTAVVNTLSFGIDEAKSAATIRTDLEKKGTPIGPYDTLIAGTALSASGNPCDP
jgi:tRNA(fMet)-specific endonuclease VapC